MVTNVPRINKMIPIKNQVEFMMLNIMFISHTNYKIKRSINDTNDIKIGIVDLALGKKKFLAYIVEKPFDV